MALINIASFAATCFLLVLWLHYHVKMEFRTSGVLPPEPTTIAGLRAFFHIATAVSIAFGAGAGECGKGDVIEPHSMRD